jgi:hypothetical protein
MFSSEKITDRLSFELKWRGLELFFLVGGADNFNTFLNWKAKFARNSYKILKIMRLTWYNLLYMQSSNFYIQYRHF